MCVNLEEKTRKSKPEMSFLPTVTFLSFNQDGSCLSVGTSRGFLIFSTFPFKRQLRVDCGPVSIVEMLYETSLVAVVGSSEGIGTSCRMVVLWNMKQAQILATLSFNFAVYAVKMNLKRLVVIFEEELRIYDLKDVNLIHRIERNSLENDFSNCVCALSCGIDKGFLAIPYCRDYGAVTLIDTYNIKGSSSVLAHQSPVFHLAFNGAGSLLATASQKGTVIRVWSVPQLEAVVSFRRGSTGCSVHHLRFSYYSDYLMSTGSTGTVHIFKFESSIADKRMHHPPSSAEAVEAFAKYISGENERDLSENKPNNVNIFEWHRSHLHPSSSSSHGAGIPVTTLTSLMNTFMVADAYKVAINSFLSYLPPRYREAIEAPRCLAWIHLRFPCSNFPAVAALRWSKQALKFEVLVASHSGCAYLYEGDEGIGGECRLRDELLLQSTMEDSSEEIYDNSKGIFV